MADELRVWREQHADTATVFAVGRIDSSTTGDVEKHLRAAAAVLDRPRRLVLDLSKVSSFGASGLDLLGVAEHVCQDQS